METFKSPFSRIHDRFSQARRIPRLGKIRLGIKLLAKSGKAYPKDVDYFVCPPEVQRLYGERPRELDVMLPAEDPEIVFPQKLAWYGSGKGLKCHGDGKSALRLDEADGKWVARECPCEHRKTDEQPQGECVETAHLMVLLPKVSMGGVYQITTRSYNSVVDLNSALDYIRALIGRVAMVPLKLRREPRETHADGKKQIHYTMTLTLDADIEGLNRLRQDTKRILATARFQIEGPVEENPAAEPPDAIEDAEVVEAEPKPADGGGQPATSRLSGTQQAPDPAGPNDLDILAADYKARIRSGTQQEAVRAANEAMADTNLTADHKADISKALNDKVKPGKR